jgi:hypothetical protein
MRFRPAAAAAPVVAAALLAAGCGGGESTAADPPRAVGSNARGIEAAARRTAPTPFGATPRAAADGSQARRCRAALGDFIDALESLANTVAVGVSYESYLSAVNHVRAAYAPIDPDDLPLLCLAEVATPAEGALNAYIEAANAWGVCLTGSSCDSGSIDPRLQRRWERAAGLLGSALAKARRSAAPPRGPPEASRSAPRSPPRAD